MTTQRSIRRRSRFGATLAVTFLTTAAGFFTAASSSAASDPTFVVNSTGDAADARVDGVCATTAGMCTLRAAMTEAARAAGHPTINFSIGGPTPHTIVPLAKLPALSNLRGTTIDGFSDSGSVPNSDPVADNSIITVEIRGNGPLSFDAFSIATSDNVIRGIAAYNFPRVFSLNGTGANRNRIVGNHVCTNADGTFGSSRLDTHGLGIFLNKGPSQNVIGAPGAANRNVISGCYHRAITMSFAPTTGNLVQNNIIGLNPRGTAKIPNRSQGVDINYTGGNIIGGTGFQEGNVISGNDGSGIEISHGRNTRDNRVEGNWFGTSTNHLSAPAYAANLLWGVRLEGPKFCGDPARQNPGGCTEDQVAEGLPHDNVINDNVIVGNLKGGILIDKGQHDNVVSNNAIGLLSNGSAAPNRKYGIGIQRGSYNNLVGPGNIIAYNPKGLEITAQGYSPPGPAQETYSNSVSQNSFYANVGLGIDLVPSTIGGSDLTQEGIKPPVIASASPSTVSGMTCAGCRVEVFSGDAVIGSEGKTYLGGGQASGSGSFSIQVSTASGMSVTATATSPAGSTSEFGIGRAVK